MIDKIRENWSSYYELSQILLELCEEQLNLAQRISSAEVEYNQVFLAEKEDGIKVTDSVARAKARTLMGSSKTQYEYEFEALNNLIQVVTSRISQLLSGTQIPEPSLHPDEANEEYSSETRLG